MDKICEELYKIGIVPVIAIDDAKDAAPLAEALIKGGLPAAEVTFRTAAAEDAIKIISEKYPEMIVGAGTVLNAEQADRAMMIAVNGMLPNNSLGRAQLKRLRTYKDANHKQEAQKPVAYEL